MDYSNPVVIDLWDGDKIGHIVPANDKIILGKQILEKDLGADEMYYDKTLKVWSARNDKVLNVSANFICLI